MDIYTLAPLRFGLEAAYHVLMSLAGLLTPLTGHSGTWLAVVVLTLAVRLVLVPVTVAQVKGDLTRARLAPRIAELQRRHGKDRARMQREVAALYQQEKASPMAGCLPTLVQLPVLMILYGIFISRTIASEPNGLLAEPFFGVALGQSLAGLIGSGAPGGAVAVFAALLVILCGLAGLTRRRMRTAAAAGAPGPLQIAQWLPYTVLIPAAVVPLAAGLYLAVSMAWTAVERPLVRRILTARTAPGAAGAPAPPSR